MTSQSFALFMIVLSGGTTSNAPVLQKVGSFHAMQDCLDASKKAVVGTNSNGLLEGMKYNFACIPENSQIAWHQDDNSVVTIHAKD